MLIKVNDVSRNVINITNPIKITVKPTQEKKSGMIYISAPAKLDFNAFINP